MTYREKLQDPRWTDKRSLILERDHFVCSCGNTFGLQVHHTDYDYDGDPWDAPDEKLVTRCVDCHYSEHSQTFLSEEILELASDDSSFGFVENMFGGVKRPRCV